MFEYMNNSVVEKTVADVNGTEYMSTECMEGQRERGIACPYRDRCREGVDGCVGGDGEKRKIVEMNR